jgi:glycine/D-amino acid oxidase-like deaminating enzyme
VEVAVVGGGVIGAVVAHGLARSGVRVGVFERHGICAEASGANAGMVGPSGAVPGVSDGLLGQVPDLFDRLSEELVHPFEWTRAGRLMLVVAESEIAAMRAFVDARAAVGLRCRFLPQDEVLSLVPAFNREAVFGAGWFPDDGHVNPFLLAHALLATAATRGATIRTGVAVTGLRTNGDRVIGISTSEGDVACGDVIVAAGAWSPEVCRDLGIQLPVWPGRGQMLVTERLPTLSPIVLRGPVVGFRQTASGNVLIGSTVEDVGFRRDVTPLIADFAAEAGRVLPRLASARILRTWAGLRPMSADGQPFIGPVPGWRGLWLVTGHGRSGISWAPITGEILTRRFLDGRYHHPQAEVLDPAGRLG